VVSRGKLGNNYNWGDADDVVDPAYECPNYGKVLLLLIGTQALPYEFHYKTTSGFSVLKELSGSYTMRNMDLWCLKMKCGR